MQTKKILVFYVCTSLVTLNIWLTTSPRTPSPSPQYHAPSPPRPRPHKFSRTSLIQSEPALGDNHILFIESSCADPNFHPPDRGLVLHPRQACSIESAARTNPHSLVYLLYTCPIKRGTFEASRGFVDHLFDYPNVRLWRVDLEKYFNGTPLETFYNNGGWSKSNWPKEHSSDVLRYLTLWKYGGTYLDLDIVVRRSLSDLGVNFAVPESDSVLASCVLNFGADRTGREVANQCLTELTKDFRGDVWGHNGPGLITRVLAKLCNVTSTPARTTFFQWLTRNKPPPVYQVAAMTPDRCSGFTVLNLTDFFPIGYGSSDLDLFFDERQSEQTMTRMENSHGVHMWNKVTYDRRVYVGSRQPYGLLAEEFCPEVYQSCGEIF